MVHRSTDSRLLSNLLVHEKEYSKALAALLSASTASLASFAAYAAASPPPVSTVIVAVAGAFAGADDALRQYAIAVDAWREQLARLKDMEDEVGNVMRDREILVTRLIKASKKPGPSSSSPLRSPSPSPSTSSLPSSLSHGSKLELPVGSKLSAAQAELQACEAHLASKERALDGMRVSTVRNGLQARCDALAMCGKTWDGIGAEGLRALEELNAGPDIPNGHAIPISASRYTPSPPPRPDSVSGPKPRSYTLHIPPAHTMPDLAFPDGSTETYSSKRVSTVEEEDEGAGEGSSVEEEGNAVFEVRENARFPGGSRTKGDDARSAFSVRGRSHDAGSSKHLERRSAVERPSKRDSSPNGKGSGRRRGGSVFGSIAALFHKNHAASGDEHGSPSHDDSPTKSGRWRTRTDKNLRSKQGDSSDEEVGARYRSATLAMQRTESPLPMSVSSPSIPSAAAVHAEAQRLRKKTKRSSVQHPRSAAHEASMDKGWESDDVAVSGKLARKSKRPTQAGKEESPRANGNASSVPATIHATRYTPTAHSSLAAMARDQAQASMSNLALSNRDQAQASLSRNSSLSKQSTTSAASAPPRTNPTLTVNGFGNSSRKRTISLDVQIPPPSPSARSPPAATVRHKRTSSTSSPVPRSGTLRLTRANDEPSLMSIVEGVTRQNDPNKLLVAPRAPPPGSELLAAESLTVVQASSAAPPSADKTQQEAQKPRTPLPVAAPTPTASRPTAKMPLRSALRNSTSRTPSPNPPIPSTSVLSALDQSLASIAQATAVNVAQHDDEVHLDDRADSVSSYETGHEAFDEDFATPMASARSTPSPPPPPPPHDDLSTPVARTSPLGSALHNGHMPASGSDTSFSTGSTVIGGSAPTRRKSVRMSLPPTFSATPPAIDDDSSNEAAVQRYEPWATPRPRRRSSTTPGDRAAVGWATRTDGRASCDVWQDSSDDEDEEYGTARRMLSRLSRKDAR